MSQKPQELLLWLLHLVIVLSFFSGVHALTPIRSPVRVKVAEVPRDMEKIRNCRYSEVPSDRPVLRATKSFLNGDAVASKSVTCLVIEEMWYPFQILGTADVRLRPSGAYVNNVMVRKEARGRGLGEMLMLGVENFVGAGKVIELEVDTTNYVAVSLYRKLGYTSPGVYAVLSVLGETFRVPLKMLMRRRT